MFPATIAQRHCSHEQANVSAALSKSAHPLALMPMGEICTAEDVDKHQAAVNAPHLVSLVRAGAVFPKSKRSNDRLPPTLKPCRCSLPALPLS